MSEIWEKKSFTTEETVQGQEAEIWESDLKKSCFFFKKVEATFVRIASWMGQNNSKCAKVNRHYKGYTTMDSRDIKLSKKHKDSSRFKSEINDCWL